MEFHPDTRIPRVRPPQEDPGSTLNDDGQRRLALARQRMVDEHLIGRGVRNSSIVDAMLRIPRECFIPEGMRDLAYADQPLHIGHDQTISQPYITALMAEHLGVRHGDRILEIGGGSGYLTALLMELGAFVCTVEVIPALAESLGIRLTSLGYREFEVSAHDGRIGWAEHAPYDGIIAAACMPAVPPAWFDQVKSDGAIIAPIGNPGGDQHLTVFKRTKNEWTAQRICPVRFVPLTGR